MKDKNNKKDFLESAWRTLWFAIEPYRGRVFGMWALIITGNAFAYTVPYFLSVLVDRVTSTGSDGLSFQLLLFPLVAVGSVLIIQEICFRIAHMIEVYTAPDVFSHITTALYQRLIQRPSSYFEIGKFNLSLPT